MHLTLEVIRQKQLTAAMYSNDAKLCYDYIVHHGFAALSLLCLGVPLFPVMMMFGKIQTFCPICTCNLKASFSGKKTQASGGTRQWCQSANLGSH